ncbi:MAG: hypothetical protein QXG05_08130 [Nitrososphaerota archaeon]
MCHSALVASYYMGAAGMLQLRRFRGTSKSSKSLMHRMNKVFFCPGP